LIGPNGIKPYKKQAIKIKEASKIKKVSQLNIRFESISPT
jgi:hypothetical protein